MDLKSVSTKIADGSKLAASKIMNTLDVIAPTFAPFAARWDAEADRRRQLRTPENLRRLMDAQRAYNSARSTASTARSQRQAARTASTNPLSAARRAARTADRAARQEVARTRAALREARRQYPATLATRAVQAHAVHAVPAAGLTAVGWEHVGAYPVSVSAALIALNAGALWLGRREVRVPVEDGLSVEERRLMERLDPSYWVQHAPDRGLGGTVTTPAKVTKAGIVCSIRLDGQWTVEKLASSMASIRALLGCRKELRIRVAEGDRGGWAVLTLSTRTAVDGTEMLWAPDREGIGVDTGTGEVVTLPHGRKLIAGTSGAGKSVLLRTVLAPYVLDPLSAVIYLDAKGEESGLWRHCAREAIDPDEIAQVVAELVEEMVSRRDLMRARQIATWRPTPERPRLVVLVDEGADLMAMDSKGTPILPGLEQIARQGRSRLVDLIWCTQKPTVGEGIPSQIIGNMDVRAVLRTAGESETRQVMGKGWQNHLLPGPGLAYVRGTGRSAEQSPVAVWNASDDSLVTSLPPRAPWRRVPEAPAIPQQAAGAERPALRLVKDEPPAPVLSDADRAVLDAVRAAGGPIRQAKVVTASGLAKGTVSKAVKRLVDAGLLARTEDGALVAAAGEVSA